MNATLPPADRERLQKLMALLDSSHEGERTAAVDAATRLLGRNGMRWSEVLSSAHVEIIPQDSPPQDAYRRQENSSRDWRATVIACTGYPLQLSEWERTFLYGLPRFPRLSAKQSAKFTAIVTRLRAAGCAL
jgi:hypothetical protein